MELQQIRYFLALTETLNFTRAAEQCGVSQPSLTRSIRKLEEELGGHLVRRERGRTHLTELGRIIHPRLLQALSLTELAANEATDFSQMSAGTFTVGVMCTIGPRRLISLVNHLNTELPQFELNLRVGSGREIIDLLLAGDVDVGVAGLPEYPDTVASHELYREPFMVSCPLDHRFARMSRVPVKELAGEKYLKRASCEYMAFFNDAASSEILENVSNMPELYRSLESLNYCHQSEHEDWIQAMVVAGLGCAIIPRHMLLSPELTMRPLVDPEIFRKISVVTVRGRPFTPIVSIFCDLVRQMNWDSELELSAVPD